MTEENKGKVKDPEKGGNNDENSDDKGKDTPDALVELKALNEKLTTQLSGQENQASAERRKLEDRIKSLEKTSETPPEDSDRISTLEVELARSKAVSRYGLSEEDAELLKGTPTEILDDAAYWADRLKERKVDEGKKPSDDDKTNRQKIDDKLNDPDKGGDPPPKKPDPKKGNLSWLERYNAGTPAARDKMDRDFDAGIDVPEK